MMMKQLRFRSNTPNTRETKDNPFIRVVPTRVSERKEKITSSNLFATYSLFLYSFFIL